MAEIVSDTFVFDKNMSIYIPRVLPIALPFVKKWMNKTDVEQYMKEYIQLILERQLGYIERIDILEKTDNKTGIKFYQAYCHLVWDESKPDVYMLQKAIVTPYETARIYYNGIDCGNYWMLAENKTPLNKEEAEIHRKLHVIEQQISELQKNGIESMEDFTKIKCMKELYKEYSEFLTRKPKINNECVIIKPPLQLEN